MYNKKPYIGQQKEPITDCESERLKKLRYCNDNELTDSELQEKQILINKFMYQQLRRSLGKK